MPIDYIVFGILAVLAIASAVITISSRHPIISAMSLVAHFFMLAGLYLTLQAQFIAVLQILVYAGAIMVLVIFVIMQKNVNYLSPNALQNGTAAVISKVFFNSYLIPFEAIGLLLLTAIIGAVMLAKRKLNN